MRFDFIANSETRSTSSTSAWLSEVAVAGSSESESDLIGLFVISRTTAAQAAKFENVAELSRNTMAAVQMQSKTLLQAIETDPAWKWANNKDNKEPLMTALQKLDDILAARVDFRNLIGFEPLPERKKAVDRAADPEQSAQFEKLCSEFVAAVNPVIEGMAKASRVLLSRHTAV
eukprot:7596613-Pyramimonas_sp.AAC.1